jgi:hypothetical protein
MTAATRPNWASPTGLRERGAMVMMSFRVIRSELALTLRQNQELRNACQQTRLDCRQAVERSVARRRDLALGKQGQRRQVAQSIARLLTSQGFSAFVAEYPHQTATEQ